MTGPNPTGSEVSAAELLNLFIESTRDGAIFVVNPDGTIQNWNSGAERLFGYREEEILDRPASILYAPEALTPGIPASEFIKARETGHSRSEGWLLRRDGIRFWATQSVTALRTNASELRGFAIVIRDRTDNRQAGDALRTSEERFRGLMDQAPFSVQVLGANGRTLRVNRAWEELWGITFDQISDYNMLEDSQLAAKGVLPHLQRAFAGEPSQIPAIRYDPNETVPGRTRHTDAARWVAAVAYPIKNAVGRVQEVILVHVDVTERKRAEDALRESEGRFAGFMHHLPGLAWIKDVHGRYVYANASAEKAFGTPREELYGKTDAELFSPATAAQFHSNDQQAIEHAGVQTFETLEHPDGTIHHSLVSKFPIPGSGGQPGFVGGVAIDVTDLRRAEDARQFLSDAGGVLSSTLDYEATLSAVARLAVPRLADWCSVYLVDTGGGFHRLAIAHADPEKTRWAEEAGQRYAPQPDDAHGVGHVIRSGEPVLVPEVTDAMLVAEARDADHLALLRQLGLRSVMIVPLVTHGRTLGAVTFVAAESGRRYEGTDLALAEELARRAALAMDNARLFHESEESLRRLGLLVEASARLTSSLELSAVQSAILDLSHRLVAADAYAMWRLDSTAGEWVIAASANLSDAYLRDWGRITGSGVQMPEHPIVAEDAQGSAALESRRRMYQAEGIESVLAVPLRLHGRVAGTLVFYYRIRRKFDDVTVRVACALADLAGAALGTAELYQREAALRRRAEEADRAKDTFLAALGHELRNPLTVVVTGLHALRELGVKGLNRIPGMERNADVLRRLVDDLLDVARVTQGRIELRREPVRATDIVSQAVETARPLIDARRHTITLELPREDVWLDADPVRLTQCLSNLLHNAAKYTEPGGQITIFTSASAAEVIFCVRDTGIGIPPDALDHIFDLFAQVQDGVSYREGGLGIGLSLVRRLVGMMGGSVTASSAGPGTGSEFVIRLPRGTAPFAQTATPPASVTQPGTSLRVVIAEDNADAAETLAILVEMWGHAVRVTGDGPGAVASALEFRPDVCLFDIGMPGFDGYEAARRIRADGSLNGVVLVAMTGYGQESDRERGAAAGFDHFLVKPVAPAEVQQLLQRLAQRRSGHW